MQSTQIKSFTLKDYGLEGQANNIKTVNNLPLFPIKRKSKSSAFNKACLSFEDFCYEVLQIKEKTSNCTASERNILVLLSSKIYNQMREHAYHKVFKECDLIKELENLAKSNPTEVKEYEKDFLLRFAEHEKIFLNLWSSLDVETYISLYNGYINEKI